MLFMARYKAYWYSFVFLVLVLVLMRETLALSF